jgi:hypothetical protein
MEGKVTRRDGSIITLEVKVDLSGSMLTAEESILAMVNEAGSLATGEALEQFDADGEPIILGKVKWYCKGAQSKTYQTPYGAVSLERQLYQQAGGGKTFCPLEYGARIIRTATPRFAKLVSHKLAQGAAGQVMADLEENHGRICMKASLQDLGTFVGEVAQAKEEAWSYATPRLEAKIKTVGIGIDGTCMLLCNGQWREAMTGSISLYDQAGARQHTIYVGAAPEYGKATFFDRMAREIAHVKLLYPQAHYAGIADGAKTNWDFLGPHVAEEILDFYHASEYLTQAAAAIWRDNRDPREAWLEHRCSLLKHEPGAIQTILQELESVDCRKWPAERRQLLARSMGYFKNHQHQMQYARDQKAGMPIGSGVTEAACKTLVKQRLCRSGMRWKPKGAQIILSLRALVLTATRWAQFWRKIDQYGVPELCG